MENSVSPPSGDLLRLGRYQLLRLIGAGAFGEVYRAHDEELGRDVAIKVLRQTAKSTNSLEAIREEARTLARLDHPNIVPIHDAGTTPDGRYYLVSRLIDGTDLKALLKSTCPSQGATVELIASIAEALHYAHQQGFVHRDVKPANILVEHSGRALLTDFGLALRTQEAGSGLTTVGTLRYMSPELACNQAQRVDARSDVFSLGIVLYEMLTRRLPFTGQTADEVRRAIGHEAPPDPTLLDPSIPEFLARICLKALEKDAENRYQTAAALAEDMRGWQMANVQVLQPAISEEVNTEFNVVWERDYARVLLRDRLRLVALITLLPMTMLLLFLFPTGADPLRRELWSDYALAGAATATLLVLWTRWSTSLPILRSIEACLFGTILAALAWRQCCWALSGWSIGVDHPGKELEFFEMAGARWSFPWFVVIVVYGVMIPNTFRRCAVAVGIMAVCAIAFALAVGSYEGSFASYAPRFCLCKLIFWVGLGMAIASSTANLFGRQRREAIQGRIVSQYQLLERVAGSQVSRVYRARHRLLKKPCVVKLVPASLAKDLQAVEKATAAVAQLSHWNTVEIFNYGCAVDGSFYIVMEYVDGPSLDRFGLSDRPFPPERVVHMLLQICASLHEAHGKGLIHANLNPGNVLICERGSLCDVVKVIDYGMAPSAAHLAPEQAADPPRADVRTDIHGVGRLGQFLLLGAGIPEDLRSILDRCMAPNPDDRYPDTAQLARALRECQCFKLWTPAHAEEWWRKRRQRREALNSSTANRNS